MHEYRMINEGKQEEMPGKSSDYVNTSEGYAGR